MTGGLAPQEPPAMAEEPVRRAEEIEQASNLYLIHPLAGWLVRLLARFGVRPNAVSLAGMGCGLLAGLAYAHYRHEGFAIAGFLLMLAWHVLDGADGQLARLTRTQSHLGKILDGVCDYTTFIAVYLGLAWAVAPRSGGWVCGLILASGLCHAVQSALYEAQRQDYLFWGHGRGTGETGPEPRSGRRIADLLYRLYAGLQRLAAGGLAGRRRRLGAAIRADPGAVPGLRRRYREAFAPHLRRWSILSSNTRTLAIFLCVLAGAPLAFFWFEIIGLSLAALLLLARQRALYDRFLAAISAGDPPDTRPAPSATAAA